jgi:prepilin-type N-terminal cleavage/methylation domain-containing protein
MKSMTRGLSLVEVMVATILLAILALLALTMMTRGLSDTTRTGTENELNHRGRMMLERLRNELGFGKVLGVFDDHRRIRFQQAIDSAGTLGYRHPTTGALTAGLYCEITAEVNAVLRESTTAPAITYSGTDIVTYGEDLTGDSDLTDGWAICRLKWSIFDAAGVLLEGTYIDDNLVLVPVSAANPALEGDVDKDGTADMLFVIRDSGGGEVANASISTAARKVSVVMFHGKLDDQGRRFLTKRNAEEIRLDLKQ